MAREPGGYFGNTTANGDIIEAVLVNTHYAYYTNYYDIETYHCNMPEYDSMPDEIYLLEKPKIVNGGGWILMHKKVYSGDVNIW